jgi:hypothetical protein
MSCDRIIVMAPKHLRTGSSSSQNVQLHSVIEEYVVLLPVTLILTKQHGRNAMFFRQITPGEAQCSASLLSSMILCQTVLNEVAQGIWGHVLKDLIFLDGGSVQLPETERGTAPRCKDRSSVATFWHPYVVWPATRRIGWVLFARPVDHIKIVA